MVKDFESITIPDNKDIKILIVDDEIGVRDVIQSFVKLKGFGFSTACDGIEAIKKLKKENFSIVVTDINMPNMDGMELLQHVKTHYPDTGVIVITGFSDEYSYIDVIKAGAIDYMTKPFDGQDFLARLHRVVKEQSLIRKLEEISISDALTGIYNRRHFDVKISEEMHRAMRQGYPIFLTLIDVDYFKEYNDTFGHQAGDNLLMTIGKILTNNARRGVDYPFRYGGDEFAIIIPQLTLEQALSVNKRIQTTYNDYKFGQTSLSFGLSEFKRSQNLSWSQEISKFIKKTDQLLYKAKNTGRAKIVY